MSFSTSRFAAGADAVRALEGLEVRTLVGGELAGVHEVVADTIRELKRLYAPVAAQIAAQSMPATGSGTVSFAKAHGFASAEKLIATGLGGTLAEARMLIEAGRTLLESDPAPEDDPEDDPDAPDDLDEVDPDDPTLTDEERERIAAEYARARQEAQARAEQERAARAAAREAARRAALSPLARALEDGQITADAAAQLRTTLTSLTADTDELKVRLADLETRLVRRAAHLSLSELRVACERAAAMFDAARAEARARRLCEARGIYFTKQADGSIRVSGQLDPATASALMVATTDYTTRAFRAARDARTPEDRTAAQMRADALAVIADHFLGCGTTPTESTATIIVEVTLDDLASASGVALNHATGTTMFAGDLRRWCAEATLIPAILGGPSEILDLGRGERCATAAQKKALIIRDGSCVWCDAPPAWCDAHHLHHWADGGPTNLDNMVLLCRSCHTRIHSTKWTIERRDGQIVIIPPPDIDPTRTPIPTHRDKTCLNTRRDDHGGTAHRPPGTASTNGRSDPSPPANATPLGHATTAGDTNTAPLF